MVGAVGPWGQLEYSSFELTAPENAIPSLSTELPRWFFGGHTKAAVIALFQQAGVEQPAIDTLARDGQWEIAAKGASVKPPLGVLLALKPGPRETIYAVLARFQENEMCRQPLPIESRTLEGRLEASGLSSKAQQTFRDLVYGAGDWRFFADVAGMLASLPDRAAQRKFMGMLLVQPTFLVRLKVDKSSPIDSIVKYWEQGDPGRPLRSLLEGLSRKPEGGTVSLAYLLPRFARRRVFTYDVGAAAASSRGTDCFWTALNFLSEQPDNRFLEPREVFKELDANYRPISGPPALGDVVLLVNRQGAPVHAAVYLADTMVFTKNGAIRSQPWVIMDQTRMRSMYDAIYTASGGPLSVVTVRRIPSPTNATTTRPI